MFALSVFGSYIKAQDLSDKIFRGARAVYIKNTMSAEENYKAAGKALVELEYGIGKTEKDFGLIASNDLNVHDPVGSPHIQRYEISVRDSLIKITSQVAFNYSNYGGDVRTGANYSFQPLIFRKKIFGGLGLFQGLLNIASTIGGEVLYGK